ncbi:Golgi phosphoprotein 3 (GPP34) [Saccharopolyspora antimicrobica]|uniref:Golgi phosphoprotein 3 (GPP34) n=1 Tax=Saccharopolyspora antimicrobica TaxID=455193 RepID=A0A1I4XCR4_9PSEU|nr:GPP34 family phosphoprotein [Saccharopolyspora antimicrobica]RKT84452.1 Golgi phosphoprotein 3 GPP34 [Saccharopolyspora antimicrobica]SFN23721.1 Golgi phosphoprotein 3 (GPP34) [Saccharopolyspora antimicrobica]
MGEYANLLTLPDEFALLLHKPSGSHVAGANSNTGTAAAEIGELVLRGRMSPQGTALQLLDAASSGHPWMDQLLAQFQQVAGRENHPVELSWWLQLRSNAFLAHRAVLVDRGVLRVERRKFLGLLPDDRYHPDRSIRSALLAELHGLARGEHPPDGRLALLGALVHRSGLEHALDFDREQRTRLRAIADREDLGEGVPTQVAAMLRAMATMPTAIAMAGG